MPSAPQLERDSEVSALRGVRDDLLGTTPAGRDWIALFERARGPLVPAVLGDRRLASDAADLIGDEVGQQTRPFGDRLAMLRPGSPAPEAMSRCCWASPTPRCSIIVTLIGAS